MPGKVKLEIVAGPMVSKHFEFDEHDTFVLGRMSDCHMYLPDDPMVSRHHFILEANPPYARIRDLGSLNGTLVNGTKQGGRMENEAPEEGARRKYPEIDIKNGDSIQVGETIIRVNIEAPMFCCECGTKITGHAREKYAWIGGTFICTKCRKKAIAAAQPPKAPEPVSCQRCGKNVSKEIAGDRRGNYICISCRSKVENNPINLLMELILKEKKQLGLAAIPKIEGYEVKNKLGQGAMGAVYLAQHKKDGKLVAIKVMLSQVAVDDRARKQFGREVEVVRQLQHEHIVKFIDDGSAGMAFYFIQEFCDGGGLDQFFQRYLGKTPLDVAGPIMLQILEGLAYAHQAKVKVTGKDGGKTTGIGVVHRDLKPQNIFLAGQKGQWIAKIGDYGLAKCFDTAGFSGWTMTGQMAGTPVFMPREQVLNYKSVKPVSDIWSIGATFYNILTNQLPRDYHKGQDPIEMVLHAPIVPIRKRDTSIPKKVAEVIDRALSVDVKDRYQDAGEMLKAMQKVL